jgi:adiponectin receptor
MVVVLFPRFRTPSWRPFRAFMFVAMGLSALFPVLHGVKTFGVAQLERQMGLSWLVAQGVLYILGAGIYAVSGFRDDVCRACEHRNNDKRLIMLQARIPEKLAPGSFDIWGSSHQIFHVLVVMAAGAVKGV